MSDFVQKAAFKHMLAVMKERDRIILEAIERLTGSVPTPKQCREHGTRSIDTLGNETYYWGGKPLVEFPKLSNQFTGSDTLTITLKYRLYV